MLKPQTQDSRYGPGFLSKIEVNQNSHGLHENHTSIVDANTSSGSFYQRFLRNNTKTQGESQLGFESANKLHLTSDSQSIFGNQENQGGKQRQDPTLKGGKGHNLRYQQESNQTNKIVPFGNQTTNGNGLQVIYKPNSSQSRNSAHQLKPPSSQSHGAKNGHGNFAGPKNQSSVLQSSTMA